tara:strand:+ start:10685 stop:11758 length:1074 start_codon:yes stop_codon:yes gene_type:complete
LTPTQPPATPGHGVCANCSAPLQGPFCAACGQSEADLRRPALSLVTDFLDGAISWDGRFLTTLRGLYTRPGRVARDYVDGKRVQFSSPVRFYLIMTLAFFALSAVIGIRPVSITLIPDAATIRNQTAEDIEARRQAWEVIDARAGSADAGPRFTCGVMPGPDEIAADGSLVFARDSGINVGLFVRGSSPEGRRLDAAAADCFRAALSSNGVSWVERMVLERVVIAAIRHPAAYEARAAAIASQAFLLMVAAFAVLNMVLHPKRRVIEHIVYSLYWNASMVPAVLLIILTFNLGGTSMLTIIPLAVLGIAIQVFAALQERAFYGSSWIGTVLRLPLLLTGYAAGMTAILIGLIWLGAS